VAIQLDMSVAAARVDSSMFALSLVYALALAAVPTVNDVNPAAPAQSPYRPSCAMDSAPTKEWTRTLTSVYSVGVTPVQDTLMWVSAGQSELKIYIYDIKDPARPLIDSFPQTGGPTGWGIRDMAWKASSNEVFGGFDNRQFNVYDATSHAVKHTYMVSGYSGVVRGFGHSPLQDSCWTCNFDSSPMTKFSITGANGHQVRATSRMASAYGIAVDAYQHCFWITQAGTSGASPTLKMDFAYSVIDSFNAEGWEQGGGCEMWKDTFLLQLNQSTPDEVFCMRFNLGPLPSHDVGVCAIVAPPGNINPGSFMPKARVMNFGLGPEANIPVTCWIDSAGVRVYSAYETLPGPLGPGLEADVAFAPNWNTGPVGAQYDVTMFTTLGGDEDTHNDTLTAPTTVAGAIFADTIHVHDAGATAPTIDGNIDAGEWSASTIYDISDILGRGGIPRPAGSCLAYFLYDSSFVYLAMDCPNRTARVNLDQFGPFMDEDWNGRWSVDSSEGGYAIEYADPRDEVIYRAVLDSFANMWEMGVAPGALSASSLASGHLQFEAQVPIGAYKWQLSIHSGDILGYFQYTAVDSSRNYIGWWPQTVTISQWPNPGYYGTMVFDSLASGVRDRNTEVPFALYRARPSVVRDQALISYYVGRQADVRLAMYDASGSLVRTLVSGRVAPGNHVATWNRTDDTGWRVADGTYFYRLVVDGVAVSGKAIVLK
jgi:hypothetical protein